MSTIWCPDCEDFHKFTRVEGATVGITCHGCRKTWGGPTLDAAQAHHPGYPPEGDA